MSLNARELRTVEAMCEAILPPDTSEWRLTVSQRVADYLRFLSRAEHGQVRLFLRALETPVIGMLGAESRADVRSVRGGFSSLNPAQRARVLRALSTSPLATARTAFEGLKRLIALAYYADSTSERYNPTWQQIGYPGPIAASETDSRTLRTMPVVAHTSIECDVAIVGSGPGGAVVAGELAERGWDVVVLEKGRYLTEQDFDQREVATLQRAYLDGGLAGTADRGVAILAGSCLGGGSVVNFTTSFRTPDAIRAEWEALTGSPMLSREEFGRSLDAVCERLGVNTDHNRPGGRDRLLESGLESLGWHVDSMPRNVVGCTQDDVCGYCGLGCIRGAKQSTTRTYLQTASDRGTRILVECSAERVTRSRDGKLHVLARTAAGLDIRVAARVVVVAGGAIHTPALLLRSGLRGPVGRNLHLHPVSAVWGEFDEPVKPWTGTLQARYSDQFADLGDGYGARLETAPIHPTYLILATPWTNASAFDQRMRQLPHLSLIGVLLRDRSAGRVRIDRSGRPVVHYGLSSYDQSHVRTAVAGAARVLQVAGAREITTSQYRAVRWLPDREPFESWQLRVDKVGYGLRDMVYGSWHQMGTCRMGNSADSVVDQFGEVRAIRNVFVADGSLFPTASGVNPMISIAALAHQVARGIHSRLAHT